MPDPSVLTWAIVAFALALLGLVAELFGRFSPAQPVCRRCGEDARGAIWRDPAACRSCGADLAARGAVRPRRPRRSKRLIAGWLVLLVLAIAVIRTDRSLAAHQLRWRDMWPVDWDVARLVDPVTGALAQERLSSLTRRLAAGSLTQEQARLVATTLLASPASPNVGCLPFLRVGWDGPAVEAWLRARINVLVGVTQSGRSVNLHVRDKEIDSITPSLRVRRLTIDGVQANGTLFELTEEMPLATLMGVRPQPGEHQVSLEVLVVVTCDYFASAEAEEAIERHEAPIVPFVALSVRVTATVLVEYDSESENPLSMTLRASGVEVLPVEPPEKREP